MKNIALYFLLTVSISLKGWSQTACINLEKDITDLIERLDGKFGNIYVSDSYVDILLNEESHKQEEKLGMAYKFINQSKLKPYKLNYSKFLAALPTAKVVSYERFKKIGSKQAGYTSEQKNYAIKVDALAQTHADNILASGPQADSINSLFDLVSTSTKAEEIEDKFHKSETKLFKLSSVYCSDQFILIVYRINFGYLEDEIYTELILR